MGQTQPIGSYGVLNGALGYTFQDGPTWLRGDSIKLAFNNLLDSTRTIALAMRDATPAGAIAVIGRSCTICPNRGRNSSGGGECAPRGAASHGVT